MVDFVNVAFPWIIRMLVITSLRLIMGSYPETCLKSTTPEISSNWKLWAPPTPTIQSLVISFLDGLAYWLYIVFRIRGRLYDPCVHHDHFFQKIRLQLCVCLLQSSRSVELELWSLDRIMAMAVAGTHNRII
jgi:hypothetical protein